MRAGKTPCWCGPARRVRLLVRFEPYTGMYLYHCHNLEHEDGGMMRNYQVES